MVSYGYNVGSAYMTATGYGKRIKAAILSSNYQQAAQVIASGPVTGKKSGYLKVLAERRKREASLFLS